MVLARGPVRRAGADRAADDRGAVRRGADDDQQIWWSLGSNSLDRLEWFYMDMGMSVLVQGCRAVWGEYSVRRCWRSQPIKGSVRG